MINEIVSSACCKLDELSLCRIDFRRCDDIHADIVSVAVNYGRFQIVSLTRFVVKDDLIVIRIAVWQ